MCRAFASSVATDKRSPNVLPLSRARPSRADHPDTGTCEARGASAPGQRTAARRLQRRVGWPAKRKRIPPMIAFNSAGSDSACLRADWVILTHKFNPGSHSYDSQIGSCVLASHDCARRTHSHAPRTRESRLEDGEWTPRALFSRLEDSEWSPGAFKSRFEGSESHLEDSSFDLRAHSFGSWQICF